MVSTYDRVMRSLRWFFDKEDWRTGAVIPRIRGPRLLMLNDEPTFELVALVTNPSRIMRIFEDDYIFDDVVLAREAPRDFNEKLGIDLETMKAVEYYFSRHNYSEDMLPSNDTETLDVARAARAFDEMDYEPTARVIDGWLRRVEQMD